MHQTTDTNGPFLWGQSGIPQYDVYRRSPMEVHPTFSWAPVPPQGTMRNSTGTNGPNGRIITTDRCYTHLVCLIMYLVEHKLHTHPSTGAQVRTPWSLREGFSSCDASLVEQIVVNSSGRQD